MQDKIAYLKFATETRGITPAADGRSAHRIRSEDLFGGCNELVIEHNGRSYILTFGPAGGLVLRAA